jgi:hypothetical protein
MANTNSSRVTALAAAKTTPTSPVNGIDLNPILIVLRGQVTCPATPSADDTLTLLSAEEVPIGARFAPEYSWVYCETDPGTALTIDVGTATDPDSLADALALTTAATTGGKVSFDASGTAPLGITDPITVTTQEDVIATVKTSTSVAETVIQFAIAFYVSA